MKRIAWAWIGWLLLAGGAWAQAYPTKPVRLLVGFNAGGPTDLVARILAEQLTDKFKQPFVVENRAGGNGAVATQAVMASAPDGYTLLVGTSGAMTVSPAMLKVMPFNPLKDITPVSFLAAYPYALVVPMSLPVTDVRGLIEYVKKNPRSVSFSSAGTGSVNHLAGEWFRSIARIDIAHVPYKGDAPALTDLIAGRVQMGFNTLTTSMPQIKAGKLRALAVTSDAQTALAPGLPTMTELGFSGFVVEPWNGIFGPANMPAELTSRINEAINEILKRPAVQARIADTGQYPVIDTPDGMKRRMEAQTQRWREIARAANIQPE